MALGLIQLLTEMRWLGHRADNLTNFLCQVSQNLSACSGISLHFTCYS